MTKELLNMLGGTVFTTQIGTQLRVKGTVENYQTNIIYTFLYYLTNGSIVLLKTYFQKEF